MGDFRLFRVIYHTSKVQGHCKLNNLKPMLHFLFLTFSDGNISFLTFSGGIEMEHRLKMG